MSIRIVIKEGKGSYKGIAQDKSFHPKGRMGAKVEAYLNDQLVYVTKNVSTLPDSISVEYARKYNGGSPVPIICEGTYDIYSHMHKGKENAIEIGKGLEATPVIRGNSLSESSYINIHSRSLNDVSNFAWSTGCITILKEDIQEMFQVLGIKTFNGQHLGKVVIDRTEIDNELMQHYNSILGEMTRYFNKDWYWRNILLKAADSNVRWEKGIDAVINLAKQQSYMGDLEIMEFLPELLIKIKDLP